MSRNKSFEFIKNTNATRYRYRQSRKKDRGAILDTFCELTGLSRKHASKVLRGSNRRGLKRGKVGRRKKYQHPKLRETLKRFWLLGDQMCGKYLQAALPVFTESYERHYGKLDCELKSELLGVSAATIDRMLKSIRYKYPRRICGTCPGSLLKNQIPIRTEQWNETTPGHFESDTVHHCGETTAGVYALSLTMTDIATQWTENRACWGKTSIAVKEQIISIEAGLPFKILGFDCDNGGEILNRELLRYFTERELPVQYTRSRAYKKNDNAHVEQKNWTHVRELLGYERFETPAVVPLLNQLYEKAWNPYRNFFVPCRKLIEKRREGSKIIKRYDKPRTPYQRLLDSGVLSPQQKKIIQQKLQQLDPITLKMEFERHLKQVFLCLKKDRLNEQRLEKKAA